MRIGFFDSGIGGLTVLADAMDVLPDADYVYYADTANVPYGTRSKDEVRRYVLEAADFMADLELDALVVACNTATSVSIEALREIYGFPVIGMEPAVKPAVENCRSKRVLVMATELALREEKFQNLVERVDSEHIVDRLPMPELVRFAEDFIFSADVMVPFLSGKLSAYNMGEYGTIVLGCTHFIYYKAIIERMFPAIAVIDGNAGTVRRLMKCLDICGHGGEKTGKLSFFCSGIEDEDHSRYLKYMDLYKKPYGG